MAFGKITIQVSKKSNKTTKKHIVDPVDQSENVSAKIVTVADVHNQKISIN